MLAYWMLFVIPALFALQAQNRIQVRFDGTRSVLFDPTSIFMFVLLSVLIGFRYKVGGDWPNYARYIIVAQNMSYADAFAEGDPSYWVLNVLAARTGLNIELVNFVCGLVFSVGLLVYCGTMERPWLAVACAVPYLVTVVAMGYTRQGVAIGFAMIGLAALRHGKFLSFSLWILAGATFHKSAVLLIPLAALLNSKNRFMSIALVIITAGIGYVTLLADSVDQLVTNYVDAEYQSAGALIRLVMNLIPAALFLFYRKRFSLSDTERKLYSLLSYISIGAFLAFFTTSASTALDRLALYLIPIQMLVFSGLPSAMTTQRSTQNLFVAGILAYYALILFVWLNFADNAYAWRPYRNSLW